MAVQFVDRQSAYPNRYKITRADGTTEHITLERADSPTVEGTPLNASTFNNMVSGLKLNNQLAAGPMIMTEGAQYGDTLPEPGTPGRIFFLKVSE